MAYRIFCERLLRGEPITVFGDGRQSRSNTYVSDCVDATIAALGRPADGAVLNIGGGRELELLDAISIISGHLASSSAGTVSTVAAGASAPGSHATSAA